MSRNTVRQKPLRGARINPILGLVSFFLFNNGMGDTEFDMCRYNNGTLANGAWMRNAEGFTYHFDSDGYADFGTTTWGIENTNEYSIFLRMCIRSNLAPDYDPILQRGRYYYPFDIKLSSYNELRFYTRTASTSFILSNTLLSLNVWYDLFFVHADDGYKAIYIDGFLDNSGTHTGTKATDSGQTNLLGKENVVENYSDIEVSNLGIFNKALTEGQVKYFDPFEMFYRNRFRGFYVAAGGSNIPVIVKHLREQRIA